MAETPTPIPEEWSDPRQVVPHLARELAERLRTMKAIAEDLAVIQGALGPDGTPADPAQVRGWITSVHARLLELNHQIANRVESYLLIADYLKRESGR